jgi:flagellar hook-basal body complex protein FliE
MSAIRGVTGIDGGPPEAWSLGRPAGPVSPEVGLGPTGATIGADGATFGATGAAGAAGALGAEGAAGVSFGDVFGALVGDAAARGHEASRKAGALAAGAEDDLHGTMIAAKEAEISLKLVGTIRTKLIEAFHELWRTGV